MILFAILFVHLDHENLHPTTILLANALVGVVGLFLYRRHIGFKLREQFLSLSIREWLVFHPNCLVQDNFKTLSIFLLFGSLVSPVVFTLTKSISTDTIYAMSTLMMLSHLIFYDYGSETAMWGTHRTKSIRAFVSSSFRVQKALSFSVALFSSVCLASRLSTSFHTFCLVTSAVLAFALWPEIRKYIKVISLRETPTAHWYPFHLLQNSSPQLFSLLTVGHIIACVVLLSRLSIVHTVLYGLAILFLTFICPLWLVHLQKYKM